MSYVIEPIYAQLVNSEGEECGNSEEIVGYGLHNEKGNLIEAEESREALLFKLYGVERPLLEMSRDAKLYIGN